jgi:HK97 family phage portal protein
MLPNRLTNAWHALIGRKSADDGPLSAFLEVMGASRSSWAGQVVNLQSAIRVAAAFACARVISEGIATMPWQVMRKAGKSVNPDDTHAVTRLLKWKPNPIQSRFEFKEMIAMHAVFCGTAYVWAPRVRGQIDALYPLKPTWVTQTYTWPKPPTYQVTTDEGQTLNLTQKDIWPIHGPSWSMYLGLEFCKIAREALGLSMAIEQSQARMNSRGIKPSGYIAVDSVLNDEQQLKLQAWIERDFVGSENAGRPMVLDRAAKWVTTSMSNVDAQTTELRTMQIEEICRFMRVLPIMVGIAQKSATYASAEQMFLAHLVHTLGPWTARIEASADAWLLSEQDVLQDGRYMEMDDRALHRMSSIDQINFLSKATSGGILVRNEAREELGRNPLPGLDEPLTPVNTVAGEPPRAGDNNQPANDPTADGNGGAGGK